MGLESKAGGSESRFAAYVEAITSVLGHADRVVPFHRTVGLLLPGDRERRADSCARRKRYGRLRMDRLLAQHGHPRHQWALCRGHWDGLS